MDMPDQDWFESRKNDAYSIQFDEDNVIDCSIQDITTSMAPSTKAGKNQFSVVFSKPGSEVFNQGVYQVSHPDAGELTLFLVPVFGDDQGVHYEAIFT
jgi:hypothetical protein